MKRRKFIKTMGAVGTISAMPMQAMGAQDEDYNPHGQGDIELIKEQKLYYSVSERHVNECYNPVIDNTPGGSGIAYLRVIDKRENLVYKEAFDSEEIVVSKNAYCFNPIVTKTHLFWIESRDKKKWEIHCKKVDKLGMSQSNVPFIAEGRPLSLHVFTENENTFLVWEERVGKTTLIKYANVVGDHFSKSVNITDGSFNGYDPVMTAAKDGFLYIAFTAFYEGNYKVLVQKIQKNGKGVGAFIVFSDSTNPSMYPSICKNRNGGVWISYTTFDTHVINEKLALVNHLKHAAQRSFFEKSGSLRVGLIDNDLIYAPMAGETPNQNQGAVAAMEVHGANNCGKSQVFEDKYGRLRILFRQHQPVGEIYFKNQNVTLINSTNRSANNSRNNYPDISIITLLDNNWSTPTRLVQHAHFDFVPTFNLKEDELLIAFIEDGRHTGWKTAGEYFDENGQIGLGVIQLKIISLGTPKYQFRRYNSRPVVSNSIANKKMKRNMDDYIHAMGQTHFHSNTSVCAREMDREHHTNYRFLQDVQHSDFGCLTDHAYNMWHIEMLYMRKLAEYYYFPGEFVSFQAYEWTSSGKASSHEGGPFGHLNPLYLDEDGDLDIYTPYDPGCKGGSAKRLIEEYKDKKIVAPPHHVADNAHPYNWDFHDENLMPIVEIFQDKRGSHEQQNVEGVTNFLHKKDWPWIIDALKKGKKFGFIASADHGGIARAGVLVKKLNRTSLFEAFKSRRTFATTGVPAKLDFSCNGKPMGSEIKASKVEFQFKMSAIYSIKEVQIIRNGEEEVVRTVKGKDFQYNWIIEKQETREFWYARIVFENGEMAWTSPIWLI